MFIPEIILLFSLSIHISTQSNISNSETVKFFSQWADAAFLTEEGALQASGELKLTHEDVKENETLDSALRRFKRNCAKAGIQQEIRKREHYEKPSVRRKKKSEAARKRKYN